MKYPERTIIDEKGNFIGAELDFDYILITDNKESFAIRAYVCDVAKINVVEKL